MPLYSLAFVVAVAFAILYYTAGQKEIGTGVPWAGLSVVVSALVLFTFHGGTFAMLLAQLALLFGIALFRTWRDPN